MEGTVLTAQRLMCATVGGAVSDTVATVSLGSEKMLSIFRLWNKKCFTTGPTLFRAGTVPETVPVRSLVSSEESTVSPVRGSFS